MTMQKQLLLLLLLVVIALNSCKKDCPEIPDPTTGDGLRFDNLAVGQTARYIGLLGENYYTPSTGDFAYTDDTLLLKIVAQDANGFQVAESLHYVGDVDDWMAQEKDSTYFYYLKVQNDTIRVQPIGSDFLHSRIFTYGVSQSGLPLKKITSQQVSISGWKTSFNYCECRQEGYAVGYELFGQTYDYLNVIVENSFMAVDGPGETYVFSKNHGIVRFSEYGWWTQAGYGWDLIPEN